jgi:GNAT superfamily N-acetyltransferase
MYSVKNLEKTDMSDYEFLADDEILQELKKFDPEKNIAIGARDQDRVLGLAFGSVYKREKEASMLGIHLLQIDLEYRNKGIGTALLRKIEKESLKRACEKMTIGFKKVEQEFEAAKRLLAKCDWESPEIHAYGYRTTIERFFKDLAWVKRKRKYPYHDYIFPWTELSEEERKSLKEEEGPDSWKVEGTSPFFFDGKFEENTSLGLRVKGKVDGWIINHQIAPDTILYGSYFVRRKYRGLGHSIGLLLESIKRQRETGIPRFTWYVQAKDKEIKRFYQKLLGPCIMSENECWQSSKMLTAQEERQVV